MNGEYLLAKVIVRDFCLTTNIALRHSAAASHLVAALTLHERHFAARTLPNHSFIHALLPGITKYIHRMAYLLQQKIILFTLFSILVQLDI